MSNNTHPTLSSPSSTSFTKDSSSTTSSPISSIHTTSQPLSPSFSPLLHPTAPSPIASLPTNLEILRPKIKKRSPLNPLSSSSSSSITSSSSTPSSPLSSPALSPFPFSFSSSLSYAESNDKEKGFDHFNMAPTSPASLHFHTLPTSFRSPPLTSSSSPTSFTPSSHSVDPISTPSPLTTPLHFPQDVSNESDSSLTSPFHSPTSLKASSFLTTDLSTSPSSPHSSSFSYPSSPTSSSSSSSSSAFAFASSKLKAELISSLETKLQFNSNSSISTDVPFSTSNLDSNTNQNSSPSSSLSSSSPPNTFSFHPTSVHNVVSGFSLSSTPKGFTSELETESSSSTKLTPPATPSTFSSVSSDPSPSSPRTVSFPAFLPSRPISRSRHLSLMQPPSSYTPIRSTSPIPSSSYATHTSFASPSSSLHTSSQEDQYPPKSFIDKLSSSSYSNSDSSIPLSPSLSKPYLSSTHQPSPSPSSSSSTCSTPLSVLTHSLSLHPTTPTPSTTPSLQSHSATYPSSQSTFFTTSSSPSPPTSYASTSSTPSSSSSSLVSNTSSPHLPSSSSVGNAATRTSSKLFIKTRRNSVAAFAALTSSSSSSSYPSSTTLSTSNLTSPLLGSSSSSTTATTTTTSTTTLTGSVSSTPTPVPPNPASSLSVSPTSFFPSPLVNASLSSTMHTSSRTTPSSSGSTLPIALPSLYYSSSSSSTPSTSSSTLSIHPFTPVPNFLTPPSPSIHSSSSSSLSSSSNSIPLFAPDTPTLPPPSPLGMSPAFTASKRNSFTSQSFSSLSSFCDPPPSPSLSMSPSLSLRSSPIPFPFRRARLNSYDSSKPPNFLLLGRSPGLLPSSVSQPPSPSVHMFPDTEELDEWSFLSSHSTHSTHSHPSHAHDASNKTNSCPLFCSFSNTTSFSTSSTSSLISPLLAPSTLSSSHRSLHPPFSRSITPTPSIPPPPSFLPPSSAAPGTSFLDRSYLSHSEYHDPTSLPSSSPSFPPSSLYSTSAPELCALNSFDTSSSGIDSSPNDLLGLSAFPPPDLSTASSFILPTSKATLNDEKEKPNDSMPSLISNVAEKATILNDQDPLDLLSSKKDLFNVDHHTLFLIRSRQIKIAKYQLPPPNVWVDWIDEYQSHSSKDFKPTTPTTFSPCSSLHDLSPSPSSTSSPSASFAPSPFLPHPDHATTTLTHPSSFHPTPTSSSSITSSPNIDTNTSSSPPSLSSSSPSTVFNPSVDAVPVSPIKPLKRRRSRKPSVSNGSYAAFFSSSSSTTNTTPTTKSEVLSNLGLKTKLTHLKKETNQSIQHYLSEITQLVEHELCETPIEQCAPTPLLQLLLTVTSLAQSILDLSLEALLQEPRTLVHTVIQIQQCFVAGQFGLDSPLGRCVYGILMSLAALARHMEMYTAGTMMARAFGHDLSSNSNASSPFSSSSSSVLSIAQNKPSEIDSMPSVLSEEQGESNRHSRISSLTDSNLNLSMETKLKPNEGMDSEIKEVSFDDGGPLKSTASTSTHASIHTDNALHTENSLKGFNVEKKGSEKEINSGTKHINETDETLLLNAMFELTFDGTFRYISPELHIFFACACSEDLMTSDVDLLTTPLSAIFDQPELLYQALHSFTLEKALQDPTFSVTVPCQVKGTLIEAKGMLVKNEFQQPSHVVFLCSGFIHTAFCHICERNVATFLFEAHSYICMEVHKAEMEMQFALDQLNEYKPTLMETNWEPNEMPFVLVLRDLITSAHHVQFHVDDFNYSLPIQICPDHLPISTECCPILVPTCLLSHQIDVSQLSSSPSSSSSPGVLHVSEQMKSVIEDLQSQLHLYLTTIVKLVQAKQRYWELLQKERLIDFKSQSTIHRPLLTPNSISTTSPVPSITSTPSIRDYTLVKPISKGAFGSVYLSKKKTTGEYFAIKMLKKADMIAKNQVTNVKAERMILMSQLENPFIVQLYCSFQSKDALYLVMEYLNGGDCASLLKAMGCLPEAWAKRYIAEMVLCLEYLHAKGIVHRDLKPDNFLIHSSGHLRLTDFGLSKLGFLGRQSNQLYSMSTSSLGMTSSSNSNLLPVSITSSPSSSHSNDPSKSSPSIQPIPLSSSSSTPLSPTHVNSIIPSLNLTMTSQITSVSPSKDPSVSLPLSSPEKMAYAPKRFVGTPDYLAPESILGISNGLGEKAVDWWALGVILYEFLYGIPPFHASTVEGVFENILKGVVVFPDDEDDEIEHLQGLKPNEEGEETNEDDDSFKVSFEAKDLILKLLCSDPSKRWTVASQVKQHPFFKDLNFDVLLTEPPLFKPEPTHLEDTDYFDRRGCDSQILSWNRSFETYPSGMMASDFGSFTYRNLSLLEKANRISLYQRKKAFQPSHLTTNITKLREFSLRSSTSSSSSTTTTSSPTSSVSFFSNYLSSLDGSSSPPLSPSSSFSPNFKATFPTPSDSNYVLVCDDNPIACKLLETILLKLGMNCIVASHGAEAVKLALGITTFHFIFMDAKMPIMDGEHASKLIRCADHVNRHSVIIGMTYEEHEIQDRTYFNFIIKKPITSRQVGQLLKSSVPFSNLPNSSQVK